MKKYTVIVPVYLREDKHKHTVIETIESIKEHSPYAKLIIVDDGSTLPTDFLRKHADIYVRQENSGISRSWNVGMSLSQTEFTVIANDDIKVCGGWLETMEDTFIGDERCGVVAPMYGGPKLNPTLLTALPTENYKSYPGYCFMLRRNVFYEPFDIRFQSNCGDTDYWHRIRRAGYKLLRAPLQIWHSEGGVLHGMDYQKLTNESLALFESKWNISPEMIIKEYYQ